FKLHFGPYRMPRCRVGGRPTCAARGAVVVRAISDGRIPWPLTKAGKHLVLVVCGGLARAVRRESALAVRHWWGASLWAVWRWRKALGVPANNAGSTRLQKAGAPEVLTEELRAKAHAAADTPAANAKKAAWRKGRPPPPTALAALEAARGRPPSDEARRRMSEAHRRRGTRPPAAGPAWTAEEQSLLGTMPDEEVARRTGRTV